jgi:PAS domain S-box-containing protein
VESPSSLARAFVSQNEDEIRLPTERPVIYVAVDPGGTVLAVNPRGAEQLGYGSRELVGRSIATICHPNDWPMTRESIRAAVREPGRWFERDARRIRRDGRVLWLRQRMRSEPATRGRPVVLEACSDVLTPKHSEQEWMENRERLQRLSFELAMAEERERRRLGLRVHDHLGQLLAAARLKLAGLTDDTAALPAPAELHAARDLIDEAIRATRSLTFELGSPVLHEFGLAPALRDLGDRTVAEHGLAVDLELEGAPRRLRREPEVILFRTARELIHNVVTHAHARRVTIALRFRAGNTLLAVSDDGQGFDPAATAVGFGPNGGFGFFSIREQLKQLGGWFLVESAPGRGTRAEAAVPG